MQGVRSTISCTSCKARKKGCDFKKPTCTRCERLHLSCDYKPRQYAFVAVSCKPGNASDILVTAPARTSTTPPSLTSTASLLGTDFTLQAMEAFWGIYLPTEEQGQDGSVGGLLSAPWVPVVREIAEANNYVKQALEACAYAGLGWVKNDYSLVRLGMQPYVYALRKVNKALQNPHQATTDTVLAACRVLSLFEMLRKLPAADREEVQGTSWQTHAAGAYQLLQLRGRARHTSSQGLHLYDGVRLMGVMQGLSQRRANTFTKLCWNLPQRDLRDELFDMMSSVPEMFEATDRLLAECSGSTVHTSENPLVQQGDILLSRYLDIAHALTAWESRALELCRSDVELSMPMDDSLSLAGECKSHGYAFFFICQQYWASCLMVYSSYHTLHANVRSLRSPETSGIPPTPACMDPELYMHNIADTCSHFFGPQAGLWAAQAAVFPLSATLMYLLRTGRRNSQPFNTITDTIGSSKTGSVMADFVHNIMQQSS